MCDEGNCIGADATKNCAQLASQKPRELSGIIVGPNGLAASSGRYQADDAALEHAPAVGTAKRQLI
jgi:hypothetical protein